MVPAQALHPAPAACGTPHPTPSQVLHWIWWERDALPVLNAVAERSAAVSPAHVVPGRVDRNALCARPCVPGLVTAT